ncbi:hypothetical protein Poly30_33090 [Planctomycetes bacterium Poly30]|uniref:Uncharacterized protein n=1 Tax=Saltatorellus ferox TaxID=2528018 RepID=A0A518EUK7_9BACT|nr:hypothetical protein Poly30_33090 [Planctomycetes bacterium Poly30]
MFTPPSVARQVLPKALIPLTLGPLALVLFALAASSCSSTGSNGGETNSSGPADSVSGTAGSVTYLNPARGNVLGLVSLSMLKEMGIPGDTPAARALSFQSNTKNSADIKVCDDQIIEGVAQLFESEGFWKYAIDGAVDPADRSLDGVLELKVNGRTSYLVNSDDAETDPEAKKTFTRLLPIYLQVYGEVRQYQAVEGQVEFKQPEISTRLRGQARPQDGGVGLFPGSIR